MRLRTFGLLAFAATFAAGAAPSASIGDPPPATAAKPVLEDKYPSRIVQFDNVEGLSDLVFATVPGFRPLHLDLYRPKNIGSRPLPLVIYVHGGGWQGGHTRHSGAFENWPGVLASLAAKGYVVASLEYRLSGEAPFPAAFDDVKAAVKWLRSQATSYGIDPSRAVIWGGSAGGHLAALTAVSCEDGKAAADDKAQSACVQGLVAWYGVFDFRSVLATERSRTPDANAPAAASRFLACASSECDPQVVARASPIDHVDSKDPPVLLIHGSRDAVVSVEQSKRFHEALQACGVSSTMKIIEGVDHSFIGSTPQQTRAASLDALEATFRFIDATIGDRK